MNASDCLAGFARLLLRLAVAAACCASSSTGQAGEPEAVRLGVGELLSGIPGEGPLRLEEVEAWLADARNHRTLDPVLPPGLDEASADIRLPADNPLTRAKIELGRQLYFDKRLSADGTVSCASCHAPDHGFAFPSRFGIGIHEQAGTRNAPSIANRLLSQRQFLDGRAASLEEQALGPIAHPKEMGFTHDGVVELCERLGGYRRQFECVFEDGVNIANVAKAIASFERAVVTGPSAWDHARRLARFEAAFEGEELDEGLAEELADLRRQAAASPLSDSATRGAELFFSDRTGCTQCHAGANFTDERYHNLGVGAESGDPGRYAITGEESDRRAFKTPTLRNVTQTAPYTHDGSLATLEEVVAFYVEGGRANANLSPLVGPLDLTKAEQADLVAFLKSLTGQWPEIETGRLPGE